LVEIRDFSYPFRGVSVRIFAITFCMGKLWWCGYLSGSKKFDDLFSRFNTIPACNRQIYILRQPQSTQCTASRGKNGAFRVRYGCSRSYRFWDILRQIMACHWNLVWGHSRTLKTAPFDGSCRLLLVSAIVIIALSCTAFEIFDVGEYIDLEIYRLRVTDPANLCTICIPLKSADPELSSCWHKVGLWEPR